MKGSSGQRGHPFDLKASIVNFVKTSMSSSHFEKMFKVWGSVWIVFYYIVYVGIYKMPHQLPQKQTLVKCFDCGI